MFIRTSGLTSFTSLNPSLYLDCQLLHINQDDGNIVRVSRRRTTRKKNGFMGLSWIVVSLKINKPAGRKQPFHSSPRNGRAPSLKPWARETTG